MTISPVEDKACWACFKTEFKPLARYGNAERILSVCSIKCYEAFIRVMPTAQPTVGKIKDLKDKK